MVAADDSAGDRIRRRPTAVPMGRPGRDRLEGARRVVLVPNCIRDHHGPRRVLGYRSGVASPAVLAAGAGWRGRSRARLARGLASLHTSTHNTLGNVGLLRPSDLINLDMNAKYVQTLSASVEEFTHDQREGGGRKPRPSKLRNEARLACAISDIGGLAFRNKAEFPAEGPEVRREISGDPGNSASHPVIGSDGEPAPRKTESANQSQFVEMNQRHESPQSQSEANFRARSQFSGTASEPVAAIFPRRPSPMEGATR